MDELRLEATNSEPKVIAICEINPKNFRYELKEAEIQIHNYTFHHNSLEKNDERGIAIYIHKSLEANSVNVSTNPRESVWLEITLNNNDKLLIGCAYRSPSNTKEQNNDFILMMKEMTQLQYSHYLIMGDFNLPKIDWNICETTSSNLADTDNRFIEVLRDAFLHQHVNTPTRNRHKENPSLLDLLITNEEGMISELEVKSPLGNSDHSCLQFCFNCYVEFKKTQVQRYIYDKGDYEGMREEIRDIDWEKELEKRITVKEKWNFISKKINSISEKYIPKSKNTNKRKLKFASPLDQKSLAKIKKKHSCWKKYMASRNSENYKEYCKFRNQVRNLTKKARRNKEVEISKDAKENPKKFWSYVNNKTKTKPGIPNLQKSDDKDDITKSDKEKAEVLLH